MRREADVWRLYEFQFLIGRLKACPQCGQRVSVLEFQFLIGRLKAEAEERLVAAASEVSIPYRKAESIVDWLHLI